MQHQTSGNHGSRVPEARVTGRPRLVVIREGGRVELPDSLAYALMTAALSLVVLLPVVLGRYS